MSGFVICGKPQFSGEKVRLGDIGVFKTGGTPSKKHPEYYGGTVPWVSTPALNGSSIGLEDATQMITQEGVDHSATKVIPEGSLMVGIRVGVGKVAVNTVPMCTNQDIVSIVGVDSDIWNIQYLSYAIQSNSSLLQSHKRGATITGITTKELKQLAIPFLPMEQQLSLVNLLNCIKRSGAKAERQLSHLDTLVKSRFNEMFEGAAAERQSLSSIVWFQEGPGVRNYQYTSHGVKLLNVANLRDGKLDTSNTDRYISETEAYGRYKHFLVDAGDLIIASSGIKVEYFEKKMGFANKDQLPLCMNTSTIRFKPIDPSVIDMQYFMYYLKSEDFKRQLDRNITGSAQLNFGPSHLKRMTIPVPSIMLQRQFSEFVQHVDKLRFILFENPSPMFGHRSFCCSTNSGNGGVILEAKDY